MVKQQVAFQAETRPIHTKSDLTRIRAEGGIPAVIYSLGKAGETIQLNAHAFNMMLKHHSGENVMLDLTVDGNAPRHVLIKDIQHHAMTGVIQHVDFHEISLDRKLRVLVLVDYTGKPVGVTQGGGTLDVHAREIEVECRASDLVESVKVDVSGLGVGDHICAGDIVLPADFKLLTPADTNIASVLKPRILDDAEVAADAAAAAEPEVIRAAPAEDAEG